MALLRRLRLRRLLRVGAVASTSVIRYCGQIRERRIKALMNSAIVPSSDEIALLVDEHLRVHLGILRPYLLAGWW